MKAKFPRVFHEFSSTFRHPPNQLTHSRTEVIVLKNVSSTTTVQNVKLHLLDQTEVFPSSQQLWFNQTLLVPDEAPLDAFGVIPYWPLRLVQLSDMVQDDFIGTSPPSVALTLIQRSPTGMAQGMTPMWGLMVRYSLSIILLF